MASTTAHERAPDLATSTTSLASAEQPVVLEAARLGRVTS
jgi:hypothetical protein